MPSTNITALIQDFAAKVTAATEAAATARVQAAVAAAFGVPAKRGPGRPKTTVAPAGASKTTSLARKAPKATAKLARARRLQGMYLGALRALGAGDRARVKAVAKSKSVAEAVKLALSLKKPKA